MSKKNKKDKTPSTLQEQAWKRAKENKQPRTGYPWDWLDYEDIKKEDERQQDQEKYCYRRQ